VPAGTVLGVEVDGLGEVVDAGLVLVREILVLNPEEALRHDQLGKGGAIFVLGHVTKLLAESGKARIGVRAGRRHRERLVRLHRRRLGRRLVRLALRPGELGNERDRRDGGEDQGQGGEGVAHRKSPFGSAMDWLKFRRRASLELRPWCGGRPLPGAALMWLIGTKQSTPSR